MVIDPFPAARRLTHVTTPYGGRIEYEYGEWLVSSAPIQHEVLLKKRRIFDRGSATHDGEWLFEYAPTSIGYNGQTTVITPTTGANTTRRLTYAYGPVQFATYPGDPAIDSLLLIDGGIGLLSSAVDDWVNGSWVELESEDRWYRSLATVYWTIGTHFNATVLRKRVIARGGTDHTTTFTYANDAFGYQYGDYHNPFQITEAGSQNRTITRIFNHGFAAYVRAKVERETVTENGESWVRMWTYDSNTGFRTQYRDFGRAYYLGITTSFTPDNSGNIVESHVGYDPSTTYAYSWGQVAQTVTPEYAVTRQVNVTGTIASETRADRTATFTYAPLDGGYHQVSTQPPGGTNAINVTFDFNGTWMTKTIRGNSEERVTLDGFGRPTLSENIVTGVKVRTRYDAEGRVAYQGYPFTGTADIGVTMEYDALHRLTKRTNPGPGQESTTMTYGTYGVVTTLDPEGRTTHQVFRAFGDPDQTRLVAVTDAKNQTWTYTYDPLGQLRTVTAPDSTIRRWEYNDQHRLSLEVHPESGQTTYTYDSAGKITQKTDQKGTVFTYTYDRNGRARSIIAGERVTTFGYEPGSDNRQWASAAVHYYLSGTIVYGSADTLFLYDAAGRQSGRQDFIDGKVFTTWYGYDSNDNLTSIAYPSLGAVSNRRRIGFDVDSANRLTRVHDLEAGRDYASAFTYHPSGGIASYVAGNGVTTEIAYDPNRYWVQTIRARTGSTTLSEFGYGNYDRVGNVRSITDTRSSGPTFGAQSFLYDELDRVVEATGPYGTSIYAYDAHGNRQSAGGSSYTYDASTLRLTNQGGVPYSYDANGNVTASTGQLFQYTPDNMLETATVNGVMTSYVYDADGWRIKAVTPSAVTYYLRGPGGQLLTEWTNPGPAGAIRDYVQAGSRLLNVINTSTTLDSGDVVGTIVTGGASVPVTVSTVNQNARLMFNGAAGQHVEVTMTGTAAFTCNWAVSVLGPNGAVLGTTTPCSGTTAVVDIAALPSTGTYVVVADPVGTTTGSVSLAIRNLTSGAPTITSVTPTIGSAGAIVTVTGTNLAPVTALRLNMTAATVITGTATSVTFAIPPLAASGRVSITTPGGSAISAESVFVPPGTYTPADVVATGSLTFGANTAMTIPTAQKIALFTFERTAGQRFFMRFAAGGITQRSFQVLTPNGGVLRDAGGYSFAPLYIDVLTAPVTGTYSIVLDPSGSYTGTDTVMLWDVPPDITTPIAPNAVGVPFTVTTPGQNGRLTFVGSAGQRVALYATNTTIPYTAVRIQAPDGSTVAANNLFNNQAIDATALPVTGTYRVLINPFDDYTGNMTLTMYDVPADFTSTIDTNNTPVTLTTTAPWQNGYLTFSGTIGQRFTVTMSSSTYPTPTCGNAVGYVLNPNGSSMALFCPSSTEFVDTKTVTVAGTHSIKVDPQFVTTGSVTVRVNTVPPDVTDSITPGGNPVTVEMLTVGQNGVLTFTGTANQRIALRTTGGTFASNCVMYGSIKKPDQSNLVGSMCMGTAGFTDVKVLPTTGTYTIVLDPQVQATGTVTVTLYDVPTDPTTSLTIGDPAQTLTTTTPGQNASATFAGTATQQVTVRITGNGIGSVTVTLLRPDGTQMTSSTSSNATFNLSTQTLPTTGTYTITVDPSSTTIGSIDVAVTTP